MKFYEKPEVDFMTFETEDIMLTSGGAGSDENVGDGGGWGENSGTNNANYLG